MKLVRGIAFLSLVALTASLAVADEPKKDDQKKEQPRGRAGLQPDRIRGQLGQFGQGPLLPADGLEKLKLTDEQRKKYDKIESEYKDKQKEASDKLRDMIQSGNAQGIIEAVQNMRDDQQKLRNDYLAKVEGILTDEQKKTFAEVKKEQPARGIRGAGGLQLPNLPNVPGRTPPAPPPVGDVLSKPAQDKLKLTDEQKKKLDEIQKETESKLNGILTDEQKKQLEELKKDTSRAPETPRRRGGNDR
jgi:Spy/CpxP family protein refolding chaperone